MILLLKQAMGHSKGSRRLRDLGAAASTKPGWALLESRYRQGLSVALQRPAFLVDALDQKCGDYRNRGVRLADVGLLVLLEVGGMSAPQIEQAPGDHAHPRGWLQSSRAGCPCSPTIAMNAGMLVQSCFAGRRVFSNRFQNTIVVKKEKAASNGGPLLKKKTATLEECERRIG
jgi:hypothetical protein